MPDRLVILLIAIPLAISAIGRLYVAGAAYEPATTAVLVLLIGTTLGNGLFEELGWRGVYLDLFGHNRFLGIAWPSVWFGLWHLAPASVSADGDTTQLVVGAVAFGYYLAFVARRTESLWWPIVIHTVAD
ncbi:MAG: CPBP family intramembrane glutamic endopeptidase [Acidimicrobiia bacterium]